MHAVKLSNSESLFEAIYTPEIKVYVDGVLAAPSAAKLSLFWPNGDEVITDKACTISAGRVISLPIAVTEKYESPLEDYRLRLKYTLASVEYQVNFLFDDCLTPLTCSVVDDDLLKLAPELGDDRWEGQTTFTTQIERAFGDVKRKLKEKGRRASMMIDATQVNDLVVTHALELIYRDFAKAPDDIWWVKYLKLAEEFGADFDKLRIKYDTDEEGEVDEVAFFGNVGLIR
jgi:hypothetical protein